MKLRRTQRDIFVLTLLFFLHAPSHSTIPPQDQDFDVQLIMDYSAVEQTLALFDDEYVNTTTLAQLRGNRIASSTAATINNQVPSINRLIQSLDSLRYHQLIRDDLYHLEAARRNAKAMRELLQEMKRCNFNRRVAATVEQIFPTDAKVSITIPVYVVALGHENVDAYVRRVSWVDDIPRFMAEGDGGELTIIINLSHSVSEETETGEQLVNLLGVVAHEVFHAAFSSYKEHSTAWKKFYADHRKPLDVLLDLTHNEGIAYYLSLDQRGRGHLPRDWSMRIRDAFTLFNQYACELSSDTITSRRVNELIRRANLSGSWENYGAMTGMAMAREIDLHLGRDGLVATIASDPYNFFRKYAELTELNGNLPKISPRVLSIIGSN